MLRNYRKPLIVAGPKLLLRHPNAVSDLEELETGTTFLPVLIDKLVKDKSLVKRVCFMSGKIYYELLKEREAVVKTSEVLLVRYVANLEQIPWQLNSQRRLEEISPFPVQEIDKIIKDFGHVKGT